MENTTKSQSNVQYMPVCVDGHGALSSWLYSFDEANNIGKNHELETHGHRWTILTRDVNAVSTEKVGIWGINNPPECSGNACRNVILSFYDGQNHWKNTSNNRKIRVEIHNWGASENIDLNPGEEKTSFIQQFFSPYKANYE